MYAALRKCVADDRLECVARGAELAERTVQILAMTIHNIAMACESRRMARRGADPFNFDALHEALDASAQLDGTMCHGITLVVEAFIERDTVRGVWDDESFLAVCFKLNDNADRCCS